MNFIALEMSILRPCCFFALDIIVSDSYKFLGVFTRIQNNPDMALKQMSIYVVSA